TAHADGARAIAGAAGRVAGPPPWAAAGTPATPSPRKSAPGNTPQSRPAGSATGMARDESPRKSRLSPAGRQRLGCTLCTLGASRASGVISFRGAGEGGITFCLRGPFGTDAGGGAGPRQAAPPSAG